MRTRIVHGLSCTLALAACGSPNGKGTGDSLDASYTSYTTEAGVDGAPTRVAGSGAVVANASPSDLVNPLQGVVVCVLEHPEIPCAMTDGAGKYAIAGIPVGADVAITFTKTGYYGVLLATHSPAADFHLPTAGMSTDAFEALLFQSAGWTYPVADKGVLHVHAQTTGNTDCTGLDATTFAASTGVAPVYEGACGDAGVSTGGDPSLTATTTTGDGDFLVTPGPIDVTATHGTLACAVSPFPGWGWTSNKWNTVSATVLAGHETLVALQCK